MDMNTETFEKFIEEHELKFTGGYEESLSLYLVFQAKRKESDEDWYMVMFTFEKPWVDYFGDSETLNEYGKLFTYKPMENRKEYTLHFEKNEVKEMIRIYTEENIFFKKK